MTAGITKTPKKKKGIIEQIVYYRVLLFMLAPAVIFFFIFAYIPMPGVVLAFKKFTYQGGVFGSPWVGLKNFEFFFRSNDAFNITKNTILYNLVFMVLNFLFQISAAIMLSEIPGKYFKKFMQSSMFLPYFISWVVIGAFVYNIFNYEFGSLNTMLDSMGMEKANVYGNVGAWKYILVFFRIWKDLGYGTILFFAAIMNIDQEMYEAAQIDGANIFQRIRVITLPCLVPTIIVLFLFSVSHIFKGDFGMFYNIIGNNGMLFDATDVIDTYVFRSLVQVQEFGMSAASGFYQSVLNLGLILLVNGIVRKMRPEYALF